MWMTLYGLELCMLLPDFLFHPAAFHIAQNVFVGLVYITTIRWAFGNCPKYVPHCILISVCAGVVVVFFVEVAPISSAPCHMSSCFKRLEFVKNVFTNWMAILYQETAFQSHQLRHCTIARLFQFIVFLKYYYTCDHKNLLLTSP